MSPVVPYGTAQIKADAPWRLLIKGMGGEPTGAVTTDGPYYVTFNASTRIYSRTTTGIINFDLNYGALTERRMSSGTYRVNPIIVTKDPVHGTGGSFWRMTEGPNVGWLVSKWTNTLGYGNITITQPAAETYFSRGPGDTLLTLYHPAAHLCGANMKYNAPGEFHFTMLVDDPNIELIQPKQQHYAIEFQNTTDSTWHEVFAGVIWDMNASDTEVVFTGIDYLGLLRVCIDERFDPAKPEKPTTTGSKYVSKTISQIITDHLNYTIAVPNSPVNFITVGSIATMSETTTIYSTMNDALSFIVGLIESHRAGTGKNTRLLVEKQDDGSYHFVVVDNPGTNLDTLPVVYGGRANGYQVIKFGDDWASRVNLIARSRDGAEVLYAPDSSGVDQSIYGRIGSGAAIVQTSGAFLPSKVKTDTKSNDLNDLKRRAKQAALDASRLGRQIGIGLKLGSFRPMEGYDLLDNLPIQINHGAVRTSDWGSDVFGAETAGVDTYVNAGYWTIVGIEWESYDDSHWMTNFILWPTGGGALLNPSPPGVTVALHGNGTDLAEVEIWASDDGNTYSVVLSETDIAAGHHWGGTGAAGIVVVDVPAAHWYHRWWRVVYRRYTSGGLRYDGGKDLSRFQLITAEITSSDGYGSPITTGVDLWDGLGIVGYWPAADGIGWAMGGGPYGTVITSSFGFGAGVIGGSGSYTAYWDIDPLPLLVPDLTVPSYQTPRVDVAYGTGAPPAVGSGTEPNATTYINTSTGERYTRNDATDAWDLVAGSATPSLMPIGGAAGDVLTKDTAADYDASWVAPITPPDAMVPYYIAPAGTFTVPVYKQAPFAVTIDNEGLLIVDGMLVEVD